MVGIEIKNKQGWIRIVEVTIALAFVIGFMAYLSTSEYLKPVKITNKNDLSGIIYPLLDKIARDNTLRQEVFTNSPSAVNKISEVITPVSQREGFNFIVSITDPTAHDTLDPVKYPSSVGKDVWVFERLVVSNKLSNSDFPKKKIVIIAWRK